MFGLPAGTSGCLFGMDGVVTQTALIHAAAWKEMSGSFLRQRAPQTGGTFVPFDSAQDYDDYADGKPRLDGTRSPGSRPATPVISRSSSGWTGSARRKNCGSMARTSWLRIWRSSTTEHRERPSCV